MGFFADRNQARDAAQLERIRAAANAVEQARGDLRDVVIQGLRDGGSWALVGRALGISRQSAYERFTR